MWGILLKWEKCFPPFQCGISISLLAQMNSQSFSFRFRSPAPRAGPLTMAGWGKHSQETDTLRTASFTSLFDLVLDQADLADPLPVASL